MERDERSERSRRAVLDAALHLFAHHGYRGTTVREIAERAGVSTGSVYHHFPDKEAVFVAVMDEFFAMMKSPAFPFTRALLASSDFPDNLEELGFAARDSVRQCRDYFALTYVDVIEFGGAHMRHFYAAAYPRFDAVFESIGVDRVQSRLRPGITPSQALDFAQRLFFQYFTRSILFGVGPASAEAAEQDAAAVQKMCDVLRHGLAAVGD